jgi:cytoskeletal protein CcmA (bactofilin family)
MNEDEDSRIQIKSGAILEGDLIWYTDGTIKPANNLISCDIENYSKRGKTFTVWRGK